MHLGVQISWLSQRILHLWVFTVREIGTNGHPGSLNVYVRSTDSKAELIKDLLSRLLVEQGPACTGNSFKSLGWTKPTAPPALRPETSRQLGSVQNRRESTYDVSDPCPQVISVPAPLQLEGTRPKVGWDGEHCRVSRGFSGVSPVF